MSRAAVGPDAGRVAGHGCDQPKEPGRISANCQQHLPARETVQRAGAEFIHATGRARRLRGQPRSGVCHHLCGFGSHSRRVGSHRGHQGAASDLQPGQQGQNVPERTRLGLSLVSSGCINMFTVML